MNKYAIATGDLVSSRTIKKEIREELYIAIDNFAKSLKRKWIDKYERFRGDSLQYSTVNIKSALRAALLMRCFIMSYKPGNAAKEDHKMRFDIRLAIGIGSIDFINEKKLSSSDGEAFVLSGQSLDNLKSGSERMFIKTGSEEDNREWETIIMLLDVIIQKWTENGAELVLQKLLGKRDDEISQSLNISVSAVTQRKKIAQWNAVNKTVQYFETKFSES